MKKNGFHNISDLDSVYDTSIPRSRGESTHVMHVLDARDESYKDTYLDLAVQNVKMYGSAIVELTKETV
jgi:hypothetical protein